MHRTACARSVDWYCSSTVNMTTRKCWHPSIASTVHATMNGITFRLSADLSIGGRGQMTTRSSRAYWQSCKKSKQYPIQLDNHKAAVGDHKHPLNSWHSPRRA